MQRIGFIGVFEQDVRQNGFARRRLVLLKMRKRGLQEGFDLRIIGGRLDLLLGLPALAKRSRYSRWLSGPLSLTYSRWDCGE